MKALRFVPILSLVAAWAAGAPPPTGSTPPEAAEVFRAAASDADLASTLAARAVENACSAQSDAAAVLIKALQSGAVDRVREARRQFDDASAAAAAAAAAGEEILQHASKGLSAIDSGKALQEKAPADTSEKAKAVRELQRLTEMATAESRKALSLAQPLKERWLAPPPATNAPAATSNLPAAPGSQHP